MCNLKRCKYIFINVPVPMFSVQVCPGRCVIMSPLYRNICLPPFKDSSLSACSHGERGLVPTFGSRQYDSNQS